MYKPLTASFAAGLVLILATAAGAQQAPPPLETVRNFQRVSDDLASSGQIGYEQIPLLREQGYEVVVNLAVADEERNGQEGFLVAREGLTYIHIPVDWNEPTLRDVEIFFDVMQANADRKVYVHCFANMRASAFVYMYRTLVEGIPEDEARATMNEVWADNPGGSCPSYTSIQEQAATYGEMEGSSERYVCIRGRKLDSRQVDGGDRQRRICNRESKSHSEKE